MFILFSEETFIVQKYPPNYEDEVMWGNRTGYKAFSVVLKILVLFVLCHLYIPLLCIENGGRSRGDWNILGGRLVRVWLKLLQEQVYYRDIPQVYHLILLNLSDVQIYIYMYQYLYWLVCIKSPASKYYALRDVSAIDFSLSFCTIIPILLVV